MKIWLIISGIIAAFAVLYAIVGVFAVMSGTESSNSLNGEIIGAVIWSAIFLASLRSFRAKKKRNTEESIDTED